MNDRAKYIKTAEEWLGAKQGDPAYTEMLHIFNTNPEGIKADTENCSEFTVSCAIKAFGTDQKYIPVSNTANAQAKKWKSLSKEPQVGALAYFDYKDGLGISHVEIVTGLTDDTIETINGNSRHKVVRMSRKKAYRYWAGFALPEWKEEGVDMTEWQKAAAGQIVLKRGSAGTMVLWFQKYLKEQGYYLRGNLDGQFGTYMQGEVLRWQKANHLQQDAIIAKHCWDFILKEA